MRKEFFLGVGLALLMPTALFADSNANGGAVVESESVFLGGPFNHGGAAGDVDNSTTTATFVGGFDANQVRFSGTNTAVNAATWAGEMGILITSPDVFNPESFQWSSGQGGTTYDTYDFDRAIAFTADDFGGAIDPVGTWDIEFTDSFNDSGIDSTTTNLTMYFERTDLSDENGVFSLGSLGIGDSASSEGELALANLYDSYSFSLTSDGTLSVLTEFQDVFTGDTLDTEIAIFDAAGNLIDQNDDFNGLYSGLELQLTAGDYTLAVGGYNTVFGDGFSVDPGAATGDYGVSMSFSAVPEPGSAAVLGLGALGLAFIRRRRA